MKKAIPRDKSKKREMIVQGAAEVFAKEGYDGASMDQIAQVAGVSKKTVYNHFDNKENLFKAIVAMLLDEREAKKVIIFDPKTSIKDQLIAFAMAEICLIDTSDKRKLSRILTLTFLKDIQFAASIRSHYEPPHIAFISWLKQASEAGRIEVDQPEEAAKLFYALVEGGVTWPALFANHLNMEATQTYLERATDLFLTYYKEIR